MVQFDKEDLYYKDYVNTITNDYNPDYTAIEDLETVNLRERFEVIYFCDAYLKRYKIDKEVENFQAIEKIVRQHRSVVINKRELFRYVESNLVMEASYY